MSLPSGAIRLNWIQSTGTQYVNTNFSPSSKSRIVFDFQSTGSSSDTIKAMFGARLNNDTKCFNMFALPATAYPQYGANAYNTKPITTNILQRTVYDMNANTTTVGGTTVSFTAETFSTGYPVYLFSLNDNGSPDSRYIKGKLYGCQIYDNGTLIRDYIPCKLSDGSVGLWDDVEGKFYGNAGSGTFVAGPAAEIVELEYIESTGTQYVDTKYLPNQNTRLILDVAYLGSAGSNVAGVRNSTTDTTNRFGIVTFGSASKIGAFFRDSSIQAVPFDNERHVFDLGKGGLSADGTSYGGANSGTFACTYPFVLFGWNEGSPGVVKTASRIYGCQLFDGGLLVRDYIPAKTIEGEVGLYDRVFHEFYRNAGTGAFIAGPEMEHEGYTELEYIESSGTQYVDIGFKPNNNTRVVLDAELVSTATPVTLFGARTAAGSNGYAVMWTDGVLRSDYNTAYTQKWSVDQLKRRIIDKNKETTTIENVSQSYSNASFQAPVNLLLLAMNNNGTVRWFASAKIYFCQIYDNGTEVRAYIPKLHPSGAAGLWDSVNERFYASATTTDLIAGPVKVTTPNPPANFRVVSEYDAEVTLAWDASENAAGYLVRQSGMVIADTQELTVTAGIQPFGYYTFEVSAYNEFGESERSALVVFRTPDNPMLWLVTDRTAQDVEALNNKGVYQATDLNRVGAAVSFLKGLLESAGFVVNVSTRGWSDLEWVNISEAAQYLANIQELRSKQAVLSTTPAAPNTMERINYTRANHIEQILLDVYTQYLIMLTTRVAAGAATSGGDYL